MPVESFLLGFRSAPVSVHRIAFEACLFKFPFSLLASSLSRVLDWLSKIPTLIKNFQSKILGSIDSLIL